MKDDELYIIQLTNEKYARFSSRPHFVEDVFGEEHKSNATPFNKTDAEAIVKEMNHPTMVKHVGICIEAKEVVPLHN
ncbi:hypothetical protein [Bacillus cereus group sp. BfR-BA-01328]|uniref:hypothetical protein n=1 Tax=Bacillus cereus group sp. BfR-BA-01328 TaxID=2920304 RepID=UPI001F5A1DF3